MRRNRIKPIVKGVLPLPKPFVCSYEAGQILKTLRLEKSWNRVLPYAPVPLDLNEVWVVGVDDADNKELPVMQPKHGTAAHALNANPVNQVSKTAIGNPGTYPPGKKARGTPRKLLNRGEAKPSHLVTSLKRHFPWEQRHRILGEVRDYLRLNKDYNRVTGRKKV